jgi:hypothetical protein
MNDPLIWFHLRASWTLTAIFGVLHAGALGCLFASELPVFLALIVGVAVIRSGYSAIARHGLRFHRDCVDDLRIDSAARVWCTLRSGAESEFWLCRDSFEHRWFVILRLLAEDGVSIRLFVAKSTVDHDVLRRIRVLLRTHDWPSEPR